jgi:hypothetical protein
MRGGSRKAIAKKRTEIAIAKTKMYATASIIKIPKVTKIILVSYPTILPTKELKLFFRWVVGKAGRREIYKLNNPHLTSQN